MTKDTIVLGKGRLYHGDRLLGTLPGGPPPREQVYRGSFTVKIENPRHVQAAFALAFGYDATPFLVGYNPQKLLPSPETIRPLTMREWYDAFARTMVRDLVMDGECFIDFDTISPTARSLDFTRLYAPRERTYEHKAAFIRVDYVDWRELELRALANDPRIRCIILDTDSPSGDLPGSYDFSAMLKRDALRTEKARAKPQPDYLKHDPSKRNKGRRRR